MQIVLKTDYTTTDLVSLAEARDHLKIGGSYDTSNITGKLEAARKMVERISDRAILNTVWTLYLDCFPSRRDIYLPKGKLQSVASVKYYNSENVLTTLVEDTDYYVSDKFDIGYVEPINDWPGVKDRRNAVQIEYTTGYGVATSEQTTWAEEAIKMYLSMQYDHASEWTNEDFYNMCFLHKIYFDYKINETNIYKGLERSTA